MKFSLGQKVKITVSDEAGEVVGRAEYKNRTDPQYLIFYKSGDGRAVESWWDEARLVEA